MSRPLLLHLVFHPASESARELARSIHHALNGPAEIPGLGVPTVFCREDGRNTPPALDFGTAERNAVALLADDDLVLDEAWRNYAAGLWRRCRQEGGQFLPFQLSESAYPVHADLAGHNFARAWRETGGERERFVVRRLVIELCRYLEGDALADPESRAPTQLFLSHTKLDLDKDPPVVEALQNHLKADQPVNAWFDSGDIATGSAFSQQIEAGVSDSSLLCVLTDSYGSREWCRKEVLLGKRHGRPIVVVDALASGETRSFSYLGNVPVIRWTGDPSAPVDLLLKETLRTLLVGQSLAAQKGPEDVVFTAPPELATAMGHAKAKILYPDPPLGDEERTLIALTEAEPSTPLERVSRERDLNGATIALSMSESTNIERVGLDPVHFDAARIELTRYLLLRGATLAYGGHLGSRGYTEALFELVRSYRFDSCVEKVAPIENYVGWPIPFSKGTRAKNALDASFVRVGRPDGVDEALHEDFIEEPTEVFPAERSAMHRYAWARGMTAMRERMSSIGCARVVLGGVYAPTTGILPDGTTREKWYAGRIPGVFEEVMISLREEQPVFLLGGFGGAAGLLAGVLTSDPDEPLPEGATWEFHQGAPHALEIRRIYEDRGEEFWDYPEMFQELRTRGLSALNPLLDEDDHRELLVSQDIGRIVELIMAGLDQL